MEAVFSSEKQVSTYKSTRRYNTEDRYQQWKSVQKLWEWRIKQTATFDMDITKYVSDDSTNCS
jgi:hypothetical protein